MKQSKAVRDHEAARDRDEEYDFKPYVQYMK